MRLVVVAVVSLLLVPASTLADSPPGLTAVERSQQIVSFGDALSALAAGDDALERATKLGVGGTTAWAALTGDVLPDVRVPELPIDVAILRLALATGATVSPEQLAAVNQLPRATQDALASVVNAFVVYHHAARLLATDSLQAAPSPAQLGVLSARNALLDSITGLATVPRGGPGPQAITILPALAIDFAGTDDTYHDDVALIIDFGGNDTYLNNAGGSRLLPSASLPLTPLACRWVEPVQQTIGVHAAGALIDLDGDDTYAPQHGCGVAGGGNTGAGFLLDAAGNDTYVVPNEPFCQFYNLGLGRGSCGANGGGYRGIGFLLDGDGNDRYEGGAIGVNGGGYVGGMGFLFDLGGNDAYTAWSSGTNGGAHVLASGLLVDLSGNDIYQATSAGTNGGGDGGRGMLIDLAGNDVYDATHSGTNGGGNAALGPTLAIAGAPREDILPGSGTLYDAEGDDSYTARFFGANGAGSRFSPGLLIDGAGQDAYDDRDGGTGSDRTVIPKGFGAQFDL